MKSVELREKGIAYKPCAPVDKVISHEDTC